MSDFRFCQRYQLTTCVPETTAQRRLGWWSYGMSTSRFPVAYSCPPKPAGDLSLSFATYKPFGFRWNRQISPPSFPRTPAITASNVMLWPTSQMRPTDINGLVTAAIWKTDWISRPTPVSLKLSRLCPRFGISPPSPMRNLWPDLLPGESPTL